MTKSHDYIGSINSCIRDNPVRSINDRIAGLPNFNAALADVVIATVFCINKCMEQYYQYNNKWICKECQREFNSRQATTSHIYRTHTNPGVSFGGHQKGNPAWNKGLKGVQISPMKGKPGSFTGRRHTEETKRKIGEKLSINNKGGRSKWYEVAGQKVQGTWERDIALKFEELGIKWKKLKTNRDTLEYVMDGKLRHYTPDFYLPDYDVLLEVKGHWWGRDREKMDIVFETYKDKNIVLIEKEQFQKILQGELVW